MSEGILFSFETNSRTGSPLDASSCTPFTAALKGALAILGITPTESVACVVDRSFNGSPTGLKGLVPLKPEDRNDLEQLVGNCTA